MESRTNNFKGKQMKFSNDIKLHNQILAVYPNAVKLVEHVIEKGELPIGTVIVNHNTIPSTTVTQNMIDKNFPSLQESFWWYVI